MTQFLIDITRFVSRIGRGKPTGIDRVEIAYLKEVVRRDAQALAVAKLGKSFVLVKAADARRLLDSLETDAPLGRLGLHDFLRLKLPKQQRKARQFLRSVALAEASSPTQILESVDLTQVEYVNVGHSNLTDRSMAAVQSAGCAQITVMVHDMIPLDHPEYTRDGITDQFRTRMKTVAKFADRVICNSADTEARVQHYFPAWGSSAKTVVAHLGVEPMTAVEKTGVGHPYFVCLGTIEPRKNHAVLFQVWEQFAATLPESEIPHLHVIGRRGWNNEEVFRLLDSSPLMGKYIFELRDLSDAALGAEIANCAGLVFPSHAEGFGLPALEAAQMGVPVICSDLPVFHEILPEYAEFVSGNDVALWGETLQTVAKKTKKSGNSAALDRPALRIPRWESHFRHVFGDTVNRQLIHE